MKRNVFVSCAIGVFLFLGLITGCALPAADGPGGAETGGAAPLGASYVPGQLVASVDAEAGSAGGAESRVAARAAGGAVFRVVNALTDPAFAPAGRAVAAGDDAFKATVVAKMGNVYTFEYSRDAFPSVEEAAAALRADLEAQGLAVRYVEPNYVYSLIDEAPGALAVHPSQSWHYDMIKAPQAWTLSPGSSGTVVAVLDTGIDLNHPSLANFIDRQRSRTYAGGTVQDVQGHGTHVSGTIASYGSVSGVMQQASLVMVKVLGDNGQGSLDGIAQGITYAAQIGAVAMNMSLGGGGYSQTMANACSLAISQGTVVVAATGNDGRNGISYPAAYPGVVSVGSVTSSRTRSDFSNYGSGLAVMAPGSTIYSCKVGSTYGTMSGTSMATPHVTGVVGLMRTYKPSAGVAEIVDVLKRTAQPAGSQLEYGSGIVDAYAALRALGGTPPEDPPPAPGNLRAGTVTARSVELLWNSSGANVAEYRVAYGGTTRSTTATSLVVDGLSPETTYAFSVVAVGTNGKTSAASALSVKTLKEGGGTYPAWDPNEIYLQGDIVSHAGRNWIAGWWTRNQEPGTTGQWGVWQPYDGGTPPVQFTITASAGPNGSISPAGAVKVDKGGSQVFTFSPATGYSVDAVAVDGVPVAFAGTSYTVRDVQADMTIRVTFKTGGTPPVDPPWAPGVSYKVGDRVSYLGSVYVCKFAHTSNAAWYPGASGLWFWEKV